MDAQSIYTIRQIIRKWHRYLNSKMFGTKYVILEIMSEHNNCTVADLANMLSLTSAAVEEAIHSLVISGLAQWVPGKESVIVPTSTGIKIAHSVRAGRMKWAQQHVGGSAVQEFQQLFELLNEMVCDVEQQTAAAAQLQSADDSVIDPFGYMVEKEASSP
ncbi:hypothetical protein MH117_07785 [Paenibacillus sp. ACRRX]|uniref:MarR family winged helix-turn-helix transcriptional regulator n=1 Tax=unclassified Paenibacillus TaxID=185978 RepID=UPI001EF3FEE0|nr:MULTISPECIES: hypothetical protein [unclassified Paenibacillus]MCG7407317.1 hypothetical protein [Paenibacillus sp. ACRRX]MDK8180543.1 hypothetical protein [Paenibacillus sp. UMB4589-SE434]